MQCSVSASLFPFPDKLSSVDTKAVRLISATITVLDTAIPAAMWRGFMKSEKINLSNNKKKMIKICLVNIRRRYDAIRVAMLTRSPKVFLILHCFPV